MMTENPMNAPTRNDGGEEQRDTVYVAMQDEHIDETTPLNSETRFNEEDWMKLQAIPSYVPRVNGHLNPDFLEVRVKMQTELGLEGSIEEDGKFNKKEAVRTFVDVPVRVQEARINRILELDNKCLEEARNKLTYVNDAENEEILKRNGEEILFSMKCCAILNSPDTHEDHKGDCRMYLTRRCSASPHGTGTGESHPPNKYYFYRLYFYAHGESANYSANEISESVDRQWVEFFENLTFLKVRSSYGFEAEYDHLSRRDTLAEFLSIDLDNVMNVFHRLSDYTEMKKFAQYEEMKNSSNSVVDCTCCAEKCTECWKPCYQTCCACCPQEHYKNKFWKWVMNENMDQELSSLVCKEETKIYKENGALIYDPYKNEDVKTTGIIHQNLSSRRFHTLNFSCIDSYESQKKYRAVIALSPDEPVSKSIEFICKMNGILDEIKRNWFLNGSNLFDPRNAYKDYDEITPNMKDFFSDLLFGGGFNIKCDVTWPYYYNGILLILFAFFGMIICFVAATVNAIFVIDGLYSLAHMGNRLYNLQFKKYVASTFYKDIGFAFFGLLLAGISATSDTSDAAAAAGAAFVFLQSFFTFFGACYQLHIYLKTKNGSTGGGGGGGGLFGGFFGKQAGGSVVKNFSPSKLFSSHV